MISSRANTSENPRDRVRPTSVGFRPRILRALRHYAMVDSVKNGTNHTKPSISKAVNFLLAAELRRRGFDPENLHLIG